MFLQLLTLGAALDADSNARNAAQMAEQNLNESRANGAESHFLMFEELDYTFRDDGNFFNFKAVDVNKKFTKKSIPVKRIKEVIEIDSSSVKYNNEYSMASSQMNRISEFHKGALVKIITFDDEFYILDTTLDKFYETLGKV